MAEENKKHTPESVAAKVARALLKAGPSLKKPRKRKGGVRAGANEKSR